VVLAMDCRETREFMSALVDNQIDDETKRKVEEHIWRCATCRNEFELEKKTKQIIKSNIKLLPVPNELVTTILTQIKLLQNGYNPHLRAIEGTSTKPWFEFAFTFGIVVVVLTLAILLTSIYENKMAQKELVAREVSGLINYFDSVAKGMAKPEILSGDFNYLQNQLILKSSFQPIVPHIPEFKLVGASINTGHSPGDAQCVNLLYQKDDKIILFHQAPLHRASMHEDVKKRILKGEWIYDTIEDESFAIWGTKELICCVVSNLSRDELERVLKQSW